MERNLNCWIQFEKEYDGKYYRFIKCPICKPEILIKPDSHIPTYCPYCGRPLIFLNLEWDDTAMYIIDNNQKL